MPIYEYRCHKCEDEFETIQRISDRPLSRCQKCGGRLEKLHSRTAFILKGSGWYSDGYAKGGGSKSPSATESGSESGKTSTKTESTGSKGGSSTPAKSE